MENKHFVVAVSREFGSGGGEISRKLAEKLNVPCYDKTLNELTSVASGFSKEAVENSVDKVSNFFEYSSFSHGNFLPVYDQIYIAQHNVIKELAEKSSCVILGRCATSILADRKDCLRVFISAPLEQRIDRITAQHDLTREEAKKMIQKIDKRRRNYYKKYADMDWEKVQNYNLAINSQIGIDKAVDLIYAVLKEYVK